MPAMLPGLSVLAPAAWWALLALAIPLLIHLFSRSRGRLVRIGHIDLIRQASRMKVTELRLTQWLLLLLRLGIFALATLILAGLVAQGHDSSTAPAVYLTPAWVQSASAEDRDAVFNDGETTPETRFFILWPGFPKADRTTLDTLAQTPAPDPGGYGATWSLLAERLSLEQHRGPVTVYATDLLRQFGRDKPALPGKINWRTSHPAPATAPAPDNIHALIAYDRERAGDASLFEAAFTALKAQRLPGLLWDSIELGQAGETPPEVDWLIRLGNGRPDTAKINPKGAPLVILSDAFDDGEDVPEQLLALPFYPFSQFRVSRLSLNPVLAPGHEDPAEWRTLLGTSELAPVLQETRMGQVRVLQFNSRFEPNWSSLAQQAEFPELLLQLMLEPGQDVRRFNDARIDPANLPGTAGTIAQGFPLPHRSLQRLLAVLLAIFWIGERWLCERRRREGH